MVMQIVYARCAGLDVHKKTVVVCVRLVGDHGMLTTHTRTFGTTTAELLHLGAWLLSLQVTHVAMESTGEYWKPVYNLLEGSFTVLVVNAAHIKYVPGRKTDVKDAEWIAELVGHGLVRPSFVPPEPIRQLRDVTRYRTEVIRERTREAQRPGPDRGLRRQNQEHLPRRPLPPPGRPSRQEARPGRPRTLRPHRHLAHHPRRGVRRPRRPVPPGTHRPRPADPPPGEPA